LPQSFDQALLEQVLGVYLAIDPADQEISKSPVILEQGFDYSGFHGIVSRVIPEKILSVRPYPGPGVKMLL